MKNLTALRAVLFIPANRPDFIDKAHTRGADAIILDLEDSVAPQRKQDARANVAPASQQLAAHGLAVLARINASWRLAVQDLEASIGADLHAIVLPKTEHAEHVRAMAEVIRELESEQGLAAGHTRLLPYIESPTGLANAFDIAAASPRVIGISLGTEDYSTAIGAIPNPATLYYPSQQLINAAVRAGVQPLGFAGSIAGFNDQDGFRAIVKRSREMGFRGACCIHPQQVAVLNAEFAPTAGELDDAEAIVASFEQARQSGRGAVAYQGRMIDAPIYQRALAILATARDTR